MGITSFLRALLSNEPDIPGVVYYNSRSDVQVTERKFEGFLHNIRLDTAPRQLIEASRPEATRPGPEEEPYTWMERIGLMPVHPSRVRGRQFYHPTTDFAMYDYDELAPEEKELTAQWMSKCLEFNMAVPAFVLFLSAMVVLPLHTRFRLPLLVACASTGVFIEGARSYLAASRERQDLDDYVLAKEIWYIKNVETYQLGLPRMKVGSEAQFHTFAERLASFDELQRPEMPQELKDLLRGV